jgi:putative component of toxin-antitoxin plasmid stabilization module
LSVLEYLDGAGSSPFAAWFRRLDAIAAAKVTTAVRRLGAGKFLEREGRRCRRVRVPVVILLGGGTKKRQRSDIADAHDRWADHKKRKAQET